VRDKPTCGVYVIQSPAGVYVGQSRDCWNRRTFRIAMTRGLPCGIIRELPLDIEQSILDTAECAVADIFHSRGFHITARVGKYNNKSRRNRTHLWLLKSFSSPKSNI